MKATVEKGTKPMLRLIPESLTDAFYLGMASKGIACVPTLSGDPNEPPVRLDIGLWSILYKLAEEN